VWCSSLLVLNEAEQTVVLKLHVLLSRVVLLQVRLVMLDVWLDESYLFVY
jgi:hypothetical protein